MKKSESSKKLMEQNDPLRKPELSYVLLKYRARFYELNYIIDKHDPIFIGWCGEFEYNLVVKSILVQIDNFSTENEILDLVYHEFVMGFGEVKSREKYLFLAKEIFRWHRKYLSRKN